MKKKSPILAAILNIVVVGLGHVYLGLWVRGITYFIIYIFVVFTVIFITRGPFIFLTMAFSVIDAFICARKINRGVPKKNVDNILKPLDEL